MDGYRDAGTLTYHNILSSNLHPVRWRYCGASDANSRSMNIDRKSMRHSAKARRLDEALALLEVQ